MNAIIIPDVEPTNWLDVVCPLCKSPANQDCMAPSGTLRKNNPHKERHAELVKVRTAWKNANRKFASRDGAPGQIWLDDDDVNPTVHDISKIGGRVQIVTGDNLISLWVDPEGFLIVNADRSFMIDPTASNAIRLVAR